MFYALITRRHHNGFPTERDVYEFSSRKARDMLVRNVNLNATYHETHRPEDCWGIPWTKYDHAEPMAARDARKMKGDAEGWKVNPWFAYGTGAVAYTVSA